MRSSSGQHWIALDHVRALAAFEVFSWHFLHSPDGPVALAGAPRLLPFALLDEGHTGVALFMTLAGYLFAKLLDGKAIDYRAFFLNRALRLLPLFLLVFGIIALGDLYKGADGVRVAETLLTGLWGPVLPNGGWSLTVELHFYLLLPGLLLLTRRWRWAPFALVGAAILGRTALLLAGKDVQFFAYWTIVGHIDHFVLGIAAFQFRRLAAGRHAAAIATASGFILLFWLFDRAGGFYASHQGVDLAPVWIVLPTLEGASYAFLIAYYDGSYAPRATGLSGAIARIGAYSYSIYLIHFFLVFRMTEFIDRHVMPLGGIYVASAWSLFCFLALVPIARLSFRCIEQPFLRYRVRYVRPAPPDQTARPARIALA